MSQRRFEFLIPDRAARVAVHKARQAVWSAISKYVAGCGGYESEPQGLCKDPEIEEINCALDHLLMEAESAIRNKQP